MISKSEFEALIKTIGNMSHYQILKLGGSASENEIQNAFHREALIYHPDRYQGLEDPVLWSHSKQVYAKVVEAYRVLSNKTQREKYDLKSKGLTPPSAKSSTVQNSEDAITAVKFKRPAASASGLKFFKLAQSAVQSRNLQSAKMNIQLALNTDPDNDEFRQLFQRIQSGLNKPK